MTFRRGEWFVRITPQREIYGGFGIVSLLSKADGTTHQELRVPFPDMDLVWAILSDA
jgi:hypothetical protein